MEMCFDLVQWVVGVSDGVWVVFVKSTNKMEGM